MKKKCVFILLIVGFLMSIIPFQSCESDKDDSDDCDTCIVARKPNLYIYLTEKTELEVYLDFPLGGDVIESIPKYKDGWYVSVDTNGLINDKYNFLFYESVQPDIWQQYEGWIINKSDLSEFFANNMKSYGFYEQEIQDFIEYWIPKLTESKYYTIYPQDYIIIEKVINLSFSIQPDNILRLFYVIIETDQIKNDELIEPKMESDFKRERFYVAEWGVILKK